MGGTATSGFGVHDPDWNPAEAIFERLIIIIPYKSPDLVKRIE
jgi:hypothetical protein